MREKTMDGKNTGFTFNWRRPFASAYLRSATGYLGLKLAIFSLAGLVGQYLLTHYLSVGDYGLLVWAGTIISLLAPFGLPGISTSITGASAKGFDGNFVKGTYLEMIGGTLGGIVLLGFAAYYWHFSHDLTKTLIFAVAGVLGPGLWLDTHICLWNGKKNFRAIFWWTVPVRIIQLVATAGVLYFSSNPLFVFLAGTAIQVIANIGATLGIIRFGGINKDFSKEYSSFGWFSSYNYVFGTITSQIDKLIIGAFFGLEDLAVFAVGELIYNYFYKVPKNMLEQIFMPRLAEMSLKEAAVWIKRRQAMIMMGMLLVVSALALALPLGYRMLFSNKYNDSIFYAYMFLVNIFCSIPILLIGAMIKAHRLKKETVIAQALISFTPIALMIPFAYLWGLKGIVLARIGQNVVVSGYCYILLGQKAR